MMGYESQIKSRATRVPDLAPNHLTKYYLHHHHHHHQPSNNAGNYCYTTPAHDTKHRLGIHGVKRVSEFLMGDPLRGRPFCGEKNLVENLEVLSRFSMKVACGLCRVTQAGTDMDPNRLKKLNPKDGHCTCHYIAGNILLSIA
jgi:hypothetical protein